MQVRQKSTDTDHVQVQHAGAASAFATTALSQTAALRTLALIATITLVAFALYMTRTGAEATGEKGASIHMTNSTTPADHVESQQEDSSAGQPASSEGTNTSSVHNEITVNGKTISVPGNGSVHKTVTDGDTTTTIDVSNSSTSTSSSVSVQSTSSSDPQEP
jgi:hypothetical protein